MTISSARSRLALYVSWPCSNTQTHTHTHKQTNNHTRSHTDQPPNMHLQSQSGTHTDVIHAQSTVVVIGSGEEVKRKGLSPLVVMKTAPPIVSDMTCFRPMIRCIHCHVYWDNSTCPKR